MMHFWYEMPNEACKMANKNNNSCRKKTCYCKIDVEAYEQGCMILGKHDNV